MMNRMGVIFGQSHPFLRFFYQLTVLVGSECLCHLGGTWYGAILLALPISGIPKKQGDHAGFWFQELEDLREDLKLLCTDLSDIFCSQQLKYTGKTPDFSELQCHQSYWWQLWLRLAWGYVKPVYLQSREGDSVVFLSEEEGLIKGRLHTECDVNRCEWNAVYNKHGFLQSFKRGKKKVFWQLNYSLGFSFYFLFLIAFHLYEDRTSLTQLAKQNKCL